MSELIKQSVDTWLNSVAYEDESDYIPSHFGLEFINFIKLVNGGQGEENKTPVLHYKMLDQIYGKKKNIANMLFRGAAKALALTEELITPNGLISMGNIQVGDDIYDRNGELCIVTHKSEIFYKPMYEILLTDGRSIKVSEDHLNIVHKITSNGKFKESVLTTAELLDKGIHYNRKKDYRNPTGKETKWWIPTGKPINLPEKYLPLDPYTVGCILGDGNINVETGFVRLHTHIKDLSHFLAEIPYETSTIRFDKRNPDTVRFSIKGIGKLVKNHVGVANTYNKSVKDLFKYTSINQRLSVLQGLMDTDGTVGLKKSSTSFTTVSKQLAEDVAWLVRSLGGVAKIKENSWKAGISYRVGIKINICPFRLQRKKDLWYPNAPDRVGILDIIPIEDQPSQCISVSSETRSFVTKDNIITHNTTLLGEYLFLYLAVYGSLPGFGEVNLALYVSDSIENGVKNMRKNLEYRWDNSDFLKKYVPQTRFTDIRWEFTNLEGKTLVVKGYGAKALSLDTRLYTETGYTTIKDCQVGDLIYGPDGKLAPITAKSEIFNKPMYRIDLADGRYLKVSEDHINSVMVNTKPNGIANWEDKDLTTKELLDLGWVHTKKGNKKHKGTSSKCTLKIKNTAPLEYPEKDLPVDPYTLGLILGDGSVKKNANGVVLTGLKADMDFYRTKIPYEKGEDYLDKRTKSVVTYAIKGINQKIRDLGLDVHGNHKFIPESYFFGSLAQRMNLLRGLLDTDGSIWGNGRITFCSASERLTKDVVRLVRSTGGKGQYSRKKNAFVAEIWMGLNPFLLPRKAKKFIWERKHWDNVNIVNIERIPDEPSQCIAIDSPSHQFLAGEYVRTHNTGVRGSKEMGKRPVLAILDDLISDEDARSKTVISSIEDTVYKAINYALHPTRNKIIWSGTPFNANDPLYKAVESGAWYVNVYPVCEEFPCTREEFKGAWSDRFTYDYVKNEYDKALATGQIHSFNQELMLRIMSDEDRVILDSDIVWYKRSNVLANKGLFNFYITTDFATSSSSKSDYSVISVWAYNHNGDWLWVDGICKRQLMDQNVNDLFRLAQEYKPQLVGIEVSGQQGGFVSWIQDQMMVRNIYFPLASEGNNKKAGIRPNTNKIQRFNVVVPWFKAGKMWFPEEKRTSPELMEMMEELSLVTVGEFKSKHDDSLDTISMLGSLTVWKPSQEVIKDEDGNEIWDDEDDHHYNYASSYIV